MAERALDAFCHASRVFGRIFVLKTIPTRNEGLLGASFDRGSWEGYGTVCLTMLVLTLLFCTGIFLSQATTDLFRIRLNMPRTCQRRLQNGKVKYVCWGLLQGSHFTW